MQILVKMAYKNKISVADIKRYSTRYLSWHVIKLVLKLVMSQSTHKYKQYKIQNKLWYLNKLLPTWEKK